MAQAREHVLPSGARGTYHVLSRCTRREFLLGGGKNEHRRAWAVGLLADLLDGFAIDLYYPSGFLRFFQAIPRIFPARVRVDRRSRHALIMIDQSPDAGNANDRPKLRHLSEFIPTHPCPGA